MSKHSNSNMSNNEITLQNVLSILTEISLSDQPVSPMLEILIEEVKNLSWISLKNLNAPIASMGPLHKHDYERIKAEYQEKLVGFLTYPDGYEAWIVDWEAYEKYKENIGV